MARIFVLSAQPGLRVSNDVSVDGPIRHVAHVIVYATLALLLLWAAGALSTGWRTGLAVLAGIVAFLYGITDEVHQKFVPDGTDLRSRLGCAWLGHRGGRSALCWRAAGPRRSAAAQRRVERRPLPAPAGLPAVAGSRHLSWRGANRVTWPSWA